MIHLSVRTATLRRTPTLVVLAAFSVLPAIALLSLFCLPTCAAPLFAIHGESEFQWKTSTPEALEAETPETTPLAKLLVSDGAKPTGQAYTYVFCGCAYDPKTPARTNLLVYQKRNELPEAEWNGHYKGDAVWLIDSDGNAARLSTTSIDLPSLSPNGTSVGLNESSGLSIKTLDGSVIATIPNASRPAWTPDGTRVAFSRETNPASRPHDIGMLVSPMYVFTIKTGATSPVTKDECWDEAITFHPSGKWLYFWSTRGPGKFRHNLVWKTTLEGEQPTPLLMENKKYSVSQIEAGYWLAPSGPYVFQASHEAGDKIWRFTFSSDSGLLLSAETVGVGDLIRSPAPLDAIHFVNSQGKDTHIHTIPCKP